MPAPTILLVDDTKLFLELEKNFLKLSPVRVLTAGNGLEALEIVRNDRPNLIFMDLHMPLMGGAACCAAIKADPALRSIPVIMVTSAGKDDDTRICREAGCDDILTKPVNRQIFLEKGRQFLQRLDRRETRIPCRTPVRFKVHNLTLSGISADLSRGGIYISTDYDIAEETPVELSFSVPANNQVVSGIKGRVAWQNNCRKIVKPAMPKGFGVEFIKLEREVLGLVSAFVELNRLEV